MLAEPSLAIGCACEAHRAKEHADRGPRFVAEVPWIEVIGQRKATVVPIGPDPRWLVAIDIVSLEKPVKPFEKTGRVVLAIHSPAILFASSDDEAVGRAHSLTVSAVLRDGRPVYNCARAETTNPSGEKQPWLATRHSSQSGLQRPRWSLTDMPPVAPTQLPRR